MEDPMDSFKAYNYDVEKFTIPSHNSTMGLLERIRKYKKSLVSGNPETLLILWYNGHGNIEGDRNDLVLCGVRDFGFLWKALLAIAATEQNVG
ncbi:hypothetical protein K4K49_003051 [Colletotrichum sp. SAR 10_70]|nr:hypothetical protein K4K50_009207 [Colletotrichum sp. SAR 10_71]KAI8173719.1 hypothetical protein K4K49_003051 [Colletotrichum sp. SAR 10_70]